MVNSFSNIEFSCIRKLPVIHLLANALFATCTGLYSSRVCLLSFVFAVALMPGRQILLALAQKYSKTLAKIITSSRKAGRWPGILAGHRTLLIENST